MSRTRQKYNEVTLYLFKQDTTDTSNVIENTHNEIGVPFQAQEVEPRQRAEFDPLSGRIRQSTTTAVYKTMSDIEFAIGDNVAEIATPTELQQSTIIQIKRKPLTNRGGKHNTLRQYEWTLVLS